MKKKKERKTEELQQMVKNRETTDDLLEESLADAIEQGIEKIIEFINLDTETIRDEPRHVTDIKYKQGRLTFDLIRERNVQKRANEGLTVRIQHLVAGNQEELKTLLESSLPTYLPNPRDKV